MSATLWWLRNVSANSTTMSDRASGTAADGADAALLRHPGLVKRIKADLADPSRAVPSSARRPRADMAGLTPAASADRVARLLAFAEQTGRRDGWSTVEDLGLLFDDPPCDDRGNKWHAAVAGLGERFDDLCIVLARSPGYPGLLLDTVYAPAVLFVRGSLVSHVPDGGAGSVAMVGSRAADRQTVDAARALAAALADVGVSVVSGLARGVDTAAHRGALDAGGHTIAVFGAGIDVVFPPENRSLVEQVVRSGAVVSQFPPGARPSKTSFPTRNAVIAGLSAASVVVDAEERSGTRIEMEYSLEFGRPVLLWAPVVGRRPWARRFAAAEANVHMVSSASEIQELVFQH